MTFLHVRRRAIAAALVLAAPAPAPAGPPNGWFLEIAQTDVAVATAWPAAAFALEPEQALHPEARASGWNATFEGLVAIAADGSYRFSVETEGGDATLVVLDEGGRELARCATDRAQRAASTAPLALRAGTAARVQVVYRRGARGAARLRTLWEMQSTENGGFRSEPIPSAAVRVPAARAQQAQAGLDDRAGRVLLRQKGCTNCHDASRAGPAFERRAGPDLDTAAARSSTSWLARWIAAPHALRAHADMPAMLKPDEHALSADLVAYLQTLSGPYAGAGADEAAPAKDARGRELYHTVGCVACHGARDPVAHVWNDPVLPQVLADHAPLVPFGDMRGRWTRELLAAFVRDPGALMKDGRMPDFRLTENEAGHIAGFLMTSLGAGGPAEDAAAGDPMRGRIAFRTRSCNACHAVAGSEPAAPAARALTDLDATRGCLDPHDVATPRYALSDDERALLTRGLLSARRTQGTFAPIEAAEHTLSYANCRACHALDGVGGVATADRPYFIELDERVDLGDEGRIPPDLSGVGFKLNTPWLRRVLSEHGAARPYMGARMPRFGTDHVATLAEALARREGVVPDQDAREPFATDQLAQSGRSLAGSNAMNCISCHQFKDYPPAGTPGPALEGFAERLRYEWWRSYIQNPARFKPGTKMPAFSVGRASHFPDLEGDIYAQGDALWCWFGLGEFMPAPLGLESPSELQIEVGATPIVLRTFMEDAGSRAIAVGTPEGVHYAFDATAVRLVEAWKGEFLNAAGAWAGRGGSTVSGLGTRLWRAPAGPALFVGQAPDPWPQFTGKDAGYRFRGYRLDAAGYPTFLYDVGETRVHETITTRLIPAALLRRAFTLDGLATGAVVWLNAGAGDSRLSNQDGVDATVHVRADGVVYELRARQGAARVAFALEVNP